MNTFYVKYMCMCMCMQFAKKQEIDSFTWPLMLDFYWQPSHKLQRQFHYFLYRRKTYFHVGWRQVSIFEGKNRTATVKNIWWCGHRCDSSSVLKMCQSTDTGVRQVWPTWTNSKGLRNYWQNKAENVSKETELGASNGMYRGWKA